MMVKFKNRFGREVDMDLGNFIDRQLDSYSGEGGVVEQTKRDLEGVKTLLVDLVKKLADKGILSVPDLAELLYEKSLKEV